MRMITRRKAIQGAAGLAAAATCGSYLKAEERPQKDVSWLAEIQPPAGVSPSDAKLTELLIHRQGSRITTAEAWKARREELRQWWLDFLGPFPAERKAAPKLEVVEEGKKK